MSRRVAELEHLCTHCDSWCEVWDDGYPGELWTSCVCGGGYAPVSVVKRYADACPLTGTGAP